ncbi:HEAT repeat domain-containing protein [Haliangium ochraceum]|uniref:PBS lyase HEAT domain protein repeat-containing protein n=1 Tax=Haliangium ochraceum (strain DSM 14365 / JCM 11303 / SMP-2) TaxID=502025 RepID=D0LXZ9_HALO1|nr:HEAT repeat domain-containing protein [Haliangium ochraceum]ACY14354.1 PBS lyase HEAT domain protein repeat-containing protein [Haliangium ochraceum DSM 14365]
MRRRYAIDLPLPALLLSSFLAVASLGCSSDPFDPQTWIEKLEDPRETQAAITQLQRLKDPVAIEPLGKVWKERGRSEQVLRTITQLAAIEDEKTGEAHWDKAVPVLRLAIEDFDVGDASSIANAKIAADALATAKDKDSLELLINAVKKSMPPQSRGHEVRRSAIRALGAFGSEARAVDTLVSVLESDIKSQPAELFAVAADALAETQSPKAVVPLIKALYRIPPIFQQVRRALIGIGDPAVPALIEVFEGKHKAINAVAKENEFNIDCDQEMGPESSCKAPTSLEFKAAAMLGDLYAAKAEKTLLAGLKEAAQPAFFFPNGAPGPTQHTAILDALRKINGDDSVAPLAAYWKDSATDDTIRPMAIDVYSMVAATGDDLDALGKFIRDEDQEESVRLASGQAYARLVTDAKDFGPLNYMVERYKKEADKFDKEVKKLEPRATKAKEGKNESKIAEAERELAIAQSRAAGYRGFQRTFEQNLARAHAGARCKKDPACYGKILSESADDFAKSMGKLVDGLDTWTDEEKESLRIAASERALLELAKMGAKGRPALDQVIAVVDSTDRVVRQGAMLAMVHTAEMPCTKCVEKLDEIIKEQDQSTLAQLTLDTRAVRNYFLSHAK